MRFLRTGYPGVRDDAGEDRDISERESYLRNKNGDAKGIWHLLITTYREICPISMPLSMKDDKCQETLAGLKGLKSF